MPSDMSKNHSIGSEKEIFIKTEDLKVIYGNSVVGLQSTNLAFFNNEITVLLGPSGAGKSTLLRALNHLVRPTAGRTIARDLGEINGRDVVRRHRLRTGMIFQQHQLIERKTVLQNVLLSRIGQYSLFRSLFPLPSKERNWGLECLDRVHYLRKRCSVVTHYPADNNNEWVLRERSHSVQILSWLMSPWPHLILRPRNSCLPCSKKFVSKMLFPLF